MAHFGQGPLWDTFASGGRLLHCDEERILLSDQYLGRAFMMTVTDEEAAHLKQWVVQKLTDM